MEEFNSIGRLNFDDRIFHQPTSTVTNDCAKSNGLELQPMEGLSALDKLREKMTKIDFKIKANKKESDNLKDFEYQVITVRSILAIAIKEGFDFAKRGEHVYFYNGTHWEEKNDDEIKSFLRGCAKKLGVDDIKADFHLFVKNLLESFLVQVPPFNTNIETDKVCINLLNGTLVIDAKKKSYELMGFDKTDNLTYQLPFAFNPNAKYPKFQSLLDKVLLDKSAQMVIAEFVASVFIPNSVCKFEKMLMLYGQGANGKSVLYKVITALLGENNVSHASITQLTEPNGYYRAQIVDKLLNYASELGKEFESEIFKKMVSGEPITARSPHVSPITFVCKTKFMVNANIFPNIKEYTHALFRRFIIIPFEVQIPESEQIKDLDTQIITTELSGVLNWVLEGLNRLLNHRQFTECESAKRTLDRFRKDSDTVQLFLEDNHYIKSDKQTVALKKELYNEYRQWCSDCGYRFPLGLHTFSERLRNAGIDITKRNSGMMVYLTKIEPTTDEC